jgi:hypothetical protein
MGMDSKTWAISVFLYVCSYYGVIGAATAVDLRIAPIFIVIVIPLVIIISQARERKLQSSEEKQWLNLRSSIPYGLVFAAITVLPFNLSTLIQAF